MKADISRPLRIPHWVPKQVAEKARELSRTGKARPNGPLLVASEADRQLLLRLTTDPRMKWVWRELGKRKRRGDGYLHPAWQSRQPVADRQGIGMALLFLHAFKLMRDEPLVERVPSASRKEIAAERERCATMATVLRAMAAVFLEPLPHLDDEEFAREDARKLEAAALVLDRLAVKPHVRDRGNTLKRFITGNLAKTCRDIFGASMNRVVGRIAGVLLGDPIISDSTIRGWHPRG